MFQNLQINSDMKKTKNISILLLAGTLGLTSCKVTQPYHEPEIPQEKLDHIYGDLQPMDSLSLAHMSIDKVFEDEHLQTLIQRTIHNNYDLKTAILRVQQSDAYFRQSKLAYLPSLSGGPSASVSKNSQAAQPNVPTTTIQNFQLGVTTGWEIDIWGKIASAERGAYASLLASDAAKRAVQTQLVAQVATLYYQLLAYDEQLRITQETIRLREEQVETIKALKEAAVTTGADVVQSEAALYEARVSIPDIQLNIQTTQNAICLLMGDTAHEIERGTLNDQLIPADLKTGVPSELLRNRPDIQMAEYNFEQAFELHNVAKADMFPSLNISAALGLSSFKIKDLFQNSLTYSANGALTQVIFGNGTKRTQLKVTDLQQQEAYLNYEKAIVSAGNEVLNALNSYEASREKEQNRMMQIESLKTAVDFNMDLLTYTSKTTYTDVLSANQSLLAAQLGAINDKLQTLLAGVEFYRALGGGQF